MRLSWLTRCMLPVLFFAVVLGARWWVVGEFGSGMPYWDQWGGESRVLSKWVAGEFGLGDFIAAHNEHRIAWSRVLWLAVFEANGRMWDNLPTLYAIAAVAAAATTLATIGYLALTGWRHLETVLVGGLIAFASPLAWLNMVWGFQVQFPMQLLLGISGLLLVAASSLEGMTIRWWIGLSLCAAGLLASGGGMLIGGALAVGVLWLCSAERRSHRHRVATGVAGLVILGVGLASGMQASLAENRFRASGAGDFIASLLHNLSWPWHEQLWPGLLLWMPLGIMLSAGLCGKWCPAKGDAFLMMAGSYIFAQFLAISWSRGVGGMPPHDRYFDLHALGLFLNFLGLLRLSDERGMSFSLPRGWLANSGRVGAAAWTALALAGVLQLASYHLAVRLPEWEINSKNQINNLHAFLDAGMDHSLLDGLARLDLPLDDPELLAQEVRFAKENGILPFVLTPPLSIGIESAEGVFASTTHALPEGVDTASERAIFLSSYTAEGGEGRARSEALVLRHGHLMFELAGMTPSGKLGLYLVDADGSRQQLEVHDYASAPDGVGWRLATVSIPAGQPVRLEVEDARPGGWFAMASLRDAKALTILAEAFKNVAPVFLMGSVAALVGLLFALRKS